MPTLRELQARLLRWREVRSSERDERGMYVFRDERWEPEMWGPTPTRDLFDTVETLAEAHGMCFLCPKSFAKNGGPVGTHSVYIWFAGSSVPGHIGHNKEGKTVRWNVIGGNSLDNLQLSPSILEQDDELPPEHRCGWHGFIGNSGVPAGCAA